MKKHMVFALQLIVECLLASMMGRIGYDANTFEYWAVVIGVVAAFILGRAYELFDNMEEYE